MLLLKVWSRDKTTFCMEPLSLAGPMTLVLFLNYVVELLPYCGPSTGTRKVIVRKGVLYRQPTDFFTVWHPKVEIMVRELFSKFPPQESILLYIILLIQRMG